MEKEKRRSGNGNWLLARLLLKDRWTRPFVDNAGRGLECDTHGNLLLNILAERKSKKMRRLCPLLLQKGFRVDESEQDCLIIPLLEACDCGRWDTVLHMLRQESIKPLVIKEALYTSLAAFEDCMDCHSVIWLLIHRMGTVTPLTAPEFLKHAMIGRAWVYCLVAVAAGFNPSMSDAARLHEVLYDTEASEDVFHYMQDMVKRHGIALFNSVDTNNGITADCFNGRKLTGGKRKKYRSRSSFSQVRYFVRILDRRSSKPGIR